MAFAKGKFGVEYNPVRYDDDPSRLLPWALGIVFLITLVSLVVTVVSRTKAEREVLQPHEDAVRIESEGPAAEPEPAAAQPVAEPELPPPEKIKTDGPAKRPTKVTNLLMRLEVAEQKHDIAMAIETIEQLRSLPGNPAADLDDPLARRLGVLNMRRLFGPEMSPWVSEITVKRGDNASRIAHEHGSTLASLAKLNGGNVDKVVIGRKLRVMDHPRLSLVVHRMTRTADLSLNGKFFKRYYLAADVKGAVGAYEVPDRLRQLLAEKGISFSPQDRAELEMLMPKGASVLIAEL
jgi:hypothetical protein